MSIAEYHGYLRECITTGTNNSLTKKPKKSWGIISPYGAMKNFDIY